MTSVLRLDEVGAGDAAIAGGKAANLGALAASGFPVPPGFVVSAQAYRESGGAEHARQEMPAPLAAAILRAHADLVGRRDGVFCVVRSSATAEDQAHASFAGQHGTYYYVTAANLLDMVRHCWASLWSPEAVAYRATHRVADAGLAMAVVVQEMVASEVSGVAFTANPVSGDRGELVIESSWGLGAALVDGRVTPDRYVLDREGLRVRERRVADKRFMVAAHVPAGTAARLTEVPAERRRRETLQPEQLETVASWALECERHFGAPQDVEWAFSEGRFHLLQSRPITGSPRAPIGAGVKGQYVLFKSLAENFTDPMTPLTADMWSVFTRPLGRVIGGRVYIDLKYVRLLVPFDLSDEDLADTLYQLSRDPRQGPARFAFRKLPLFLLVALVKYLVAGVPFARTRDMPDDFMDHTRVLCRRIEQDPAVSPLQALRRLWLLPRFLGPIGEASMIVNWASLRFLPWMQVVKAMLRRWAPELPAETAAQLCCGMEGVKSADMGRAVSALASTSQAAPAEFAAALDRFLAVHGHRAIKEFELRTPRWDEDPGPVLGMVRGAALRADGRVAADVGRARAAAEEDVRHALRRQPLERRLGVRGRLLRLAARRARYYFKLRENSRFHHVMGFGVVRKKVLRVEKELLADGRLRCQDDVFFLHFDEMAALQAGRLGWLDVEDRIRERRLEHVRLSKTMPPKTIGIPLTRRPPADSPDDGLAGQTASPGRYEGVARVILDPSTDDSLRPGEVLVAPYTDPAWTPLFLIAGAAVVEVGSYLSHAGTVAREYGMPCVVDVPDCTRRIQTGMRVEVDADHGRVRILGQGAAA